MAILLAMISAAALATTEPKAPSAAVPAASGSKMICKGVKLTGSRLARSKICMTQREWDMEAEQISSDLRAYSGRGVRASTK